MHYQRHGLKMVKCTRSIRPVGWALGWGVGEREKERRVKERYLIFIIRVYPELGWFIVLKQDVFTSWSM